MLHCLLVSHILMADSRPIRQISVRNPQIIASISAGHRVHLARNLRQIADAELAKRGEKRPVTAANILCMMPLTAKLCRPW